MAEKSKVKYSQLKSDAEPLEADAALDSSAPLEEVGEAEVHSGLPMEPSEEAVKRLQAELDEVRDRYLRLAAEFDNYRKRVARERAEIADRSQATLLAKFVDAIDDIDRVLAGDPTAPQAEALHEGIKLVEKKLWKELEAAGLEVIQPTGAAFDPSLHEAVSIVAPPEGAKPNTVGATLQSGYRFKGVLIRPAKVQVYADQGQH